MRALKGCLGGPAIRPPKPLSAEPSKNPSIWIMLIGAGALKKLWPATTWYWNRACSMWCQNWIQKAAIHMERHSPAGHGGRLALALSLGLLAATAQAQAPFPASTAPPPAADGAAPPAGQPAADKPKETPKDAAPT